MKSANENLWFLESDMFFKVLVVDDEAISLESTRSLLESRGFRVDTASSGDDALEKLKSSPSQYALAILDYRMGGKDGAMTSRELLSINPDLNILIHSGDDSSEVIKSAWEAGAQRFIGKSEDSEVFVSKVMKWYKKFEGAHQPSSPGFASPSEIALIESVAMIGRSKALVEIVRQTKRYAPLRESVLILGETGSGKETVAKALHFGEPSLFYPVNCAAFKGDSNLMESELFGYMRGAFTGADRDKKGILELAKGGTVFLDEIQALSLVAQEKLLRVLQEKKIRPVGAHREFEVDFRLIAAGKSNLKDMADRNEFLPDLYERLNVLNIKVPPLRERREDIEPLIHHFCRVYEKKSGARKSFSARAIRYMEEYPWPRNIRQLENTIRRFCINVESEVITEKDIEGKIDDETLTASSGAVPLRTRILEVERTNMLSLLQRARSIREAARRANVPETTFRRLMRKHGLPFAGWNASSNSGE